MTSSLNDTQVFQILLQISAVMIIFTLLSFWWMCIGKITLYFSFQSKPVNFFIHLLLLFTS